MDILNLFTDPDCVEKIQSRLPELFYLAELESSRAGNIGMEVGSARERIIIALLIYKFGGDNVKTNIPITEPEVDVAVFNKLISIKTITGKRLGGVKIIWTVDAQRALQFSENYIPCCDILLVQLNWNDVGWFYYFPRTSQSEILEKIGRERYIKLPKPGTNPRGVEISAEALDMLANHPETKSIQIEWHHRAIDYNPYQRWLELWGKD